MMDRRKSWSRDRSQVASRQPRDMAASNVRPLIVLMLVITLMIFIILDSMDLACTIRKPGSPL